MSALARETYRGSTAFAPQLRQERSNAATAQDPAVFARRERYPAAVSLPEPKCINVYLQIGDRTIRVTYPDLGTGLPSWASPVLLSMSERWGAARGWDTYDAEPTDLQHAVQLLNYLSKVMRDSFTPPEITPLSDGGVQAEWHREHQDLEIVVTADEPARYYYYNATTREEEEEELAHKVEHVSALIAQL